MTSVFAIDLQAVSHSYGEKRALCDVTLSVGEQEIFGLLGPNGGGKSTLFGLLSTMLPLQRGDAHVLGFDLRSEDEAIRKRIGVTFQSPSLDVRLTVYENLKHQAILYGLSGRHMRTRIDQLLEWMELSDRRQDRVHSLSGGMKRRVEIAKGLLHQPQLLLLDEPSTGLDPGGRHLMWQDLRRLRDESGVTILVTTHLMDEADRCDRLGILDQGRLVALGTPDGLRSSLGGECLTIHADRPQSLAADIKRQYGVEAVFVDPVLRLESTEGRELLANLLRDFGDSIRSVSIGKPTLDDVFITRTGRRFDEQGETPTEK